MSTVTGKIRVLPPDTPGATSSVPVATEDGIWGYWASECCGQELPYDAVTPPTDLAEVLPTVAYVCTRPPHAPVEVHVCHLLRSVTTGPDVGVLIVWGGE